MNVFDLLLHVLFYVTFIVLILVALDNKARLDEIKNYFTKKAEGAENGKDSETKNQADKQE